MAACELWRRAPNFFAENCKNIDDKADYSDNIRGNYIVKSRGTDGSKIH